MAFLLGNGVLQPRGLMTVPTAYTGDNTRAWGTVQFKTGVNGAFAATPNGGDVFIEAAAMSLRSAYRSGAIWAMNRFTLAAAMKLKTAMAITFGTHLEFTRRAIWYYLRYCNRA